MQHDINNHVAVIRSLTANAEEGTDLKQYAEELTAPKLLHPHYCRNTILNALLVNKAADCRKAGIEAEFDIHLAAGTEGYDDYDLVALVSNLLDNAIEAAGTAENKQLALTMHLADGALSILCRQSGQNDPRQRQGDHQPAGEKVQRRAGAAPRGGELHRFGNAVRPGERSEKGRIRQIFRKAPEGAFLFWGEDLYWAWLVLAYRRDKVLQMA